MRKTDEQKIENMVYKDYEKSGKLDIFPLLDEIEKTEIEFDSIWIDEDVEQDMQHISGMYAKENFFKEKESFINLASMHNEYCLVIPGKYKQHEFHLLLYPELGKIRMVTEDLKLEIEDVIKNINVY